MIAINKFSLIMALGVGLGLIWYIKPVSKSPTVSRERLNIAAITIAGAIFGGRIGHVLMNMTYFQAHLVETVQVWLGGFSWIGFTVGAFIAIYIATRIKGIPFLKTTDDLTPLFTTTAVFIWLACWITGYAYGTKVDAWWGIPTSNEWGELTQRWPTQLLGGVTILSLQLLIEYSRKQKLFKIPGTATSFILAGVSVVTFIISHFRADQVPLWRGIKLDIWISIFLITLSASIALNLIYRMLTRFQKSNAGKHEN